MKYLGHFRWLWDLFGFCGIVFFTILFLFSGCAKQSSETSVTTSVSAGYVPGQTNVLVPKTGQDAAVSQGPLLLDFSYSEQGYFTGTLSESGSKINIQVTGPDEVIYKYFIETPGETAVFPFTAGSGNYLILAFEHIGDEQYAALLTYSLEVTLENEFLPFLYPNQYVDFTADSKAVVLARELSTDAGTDLDALSAVYRYVTGSIVYDNEKAATVETGYLPDIDETLRTGTGICFDYAALTASMLRALSIPTRLEIGYSGDIRHAWIDVYIESMGWVENAIEFNGDEWNLMDPTFAAAAQDDELVREYVGDGSNYTLLYVR